LNVFSEIMISATNERRSVKRLIGHRDSKKKFPRPSANRVWTVSEGHYSGLRILNSGS
jgi:hypothetical protein